MKVIGCVYTEKRVADMIEEDTSSNDVFVDRVSPLPYGKNNVHREDDTFPYLFPRNKLRLPTI